MLNEEVIVSPIATLLEHENDEPVNEGEDDDTTVDEEYASNSRLTFSYDYDYTVAADSRKRTGNLSAAPAPQEQRPGPKEVTTETTKPAPLRQSSPHPAQFPSQSNTQPRLSSSVDVHINDWDWPSSWAIPGSGNPLHATLEAVRGMDTSFTIMVVMSLDDDMVTTSRTYEDFQELQTALADALGPVVHTWMNASLTIVEDFQNLKINTAPQLTP